MHPQLGLTAVRKAQDLIKKSATAGLLSDYYLITTANLNIGVWGTWRLDYPKFKISSLPHVPALPSGT